LPMISAIRTLLCWECRHLKSLVRFEIKGWALSNRHAGL